MIVVKDKRGMVALLTIVIVSTAVLLMAFSAIILGLGDLDMGWTSQKGNEAQALAEGCAEEALRRLYLDENYSGETLNIGQNSCIISVTSNGFERAIAVAASVGEYNNKLLVKATLNGDTIVLNSWQEEEN